MRKALNYVFRILGAVLLFLLLCAIAIPLLFKKEITESVRRAINRQIEGAFYFEKAQVGILRTFPNLCLEFTSPVLTGGAHPAGDSLFVAESLGVIIDIKSLVRRGEPFKVIGIRLSTPRISLYSDSSGVTNYQLFPPEDSTITDTSSSALVVEIDDYRIENGRLKYVDDETEIRILAANLIHHGRLRYEDNDIELRTKTDNGILTIEVGGLTYFDSVHIKGNNDLDIDMENSIYTLLENIVTLNAFEVEAHGHIAQTEETTSFDMEFSGEHNTFKNLISLLPNIYTSEFDALDASGNIAFTGKLKGTLSELNVPVYEIKLQVDNGAFQFPGKPLGFRDVAFRGALENSSKGWQPIDIDLSSLHFLLNNRPFDANIRIQNPTEKAAYQGVIKGSVDLADVAKAYPLPQVNALQGLIDADVRFDIDASRQTTDQNVSGKLLLERILLRAQDEEFSMQSGHVDFTSGAIHAVSESASWNGSSLQADITARDYIGWLTKDEPMTIAGSIAMDKFDANRYLTAEDTSIQTVPTTYDPALSLIRFDGTLAVNTLIYDSYVIEHGSAILDGTLQSLQIEQMQGKINGTQFTANGTITDIHKYLDVTSPLVGSLDCKLDTVYVDRWIEDDITPGDATTTSGTSYVALPEDLKIDVTFRADGLRYDNIEIQNPHGALHLANRVLEIYDFKGSGMGGKIVFSGLYNTQDIQHPAFSMKYDLSSISFSEAFRQVETFQKLAPIAQFVQGIFNSTLVFEGRLGENYIPDFNTLNSSGYLETLTGSLADADILNKVSEFLNLKKPLRWDFGKTRNWFEVKDGYVKLQEVQKTVDGIEVALGGRHRIQGEMDYLIKLNIPAGTQPEQVFRLAGRGMPYVKNPKEKGDLYVKLKVQIPKYLSSKQRELLEEVSKIKF